MRLRQAWPGTISSGIVLILLVGCNPYSPDEDDLVEVPSGETTDNFAITVTTWIPGGGTGPPIMDAMVYVEFVDTDHLDDHGQYVVRITANGITDPAGVWTRAVTYHGTGKLAADKVRYNVEHSTYLPGRGQTFLRNHNAAAKIGLVPDS